MFRVGFVDEF